MDVRSLYAKRFDGTEKNKREIWDVLCKHFFKQFISNEDIVMDIAAGNCEFINSITAREKIAFDLNPDIHKFASECVTAINDTFFNVQKHIDKKFNVIFASNVLEHLDSKECVISAIKLCYQILVSGGRLLILQPNIKYTKGAYWDFIDHKVPLTDQALIEAGELCGFTTVKNIPRFLPYTTKSSMPQNPFLVYLYLKMPIAWYLFGKQSFLIMEKKSD